MMSESESGWPSPDEVVAALDASGYLLEQEVAFELERLGFHAVSNRAFQDPEEDKSREIDVWAHRSMWRDEGRKVQVLVQLLVECKATKAPYAVLARPRKGLLTSAPRELVLPIPEYETDHAVNSKGQRTHQTTSGFAHMNLALHHWAWVDNRVGVSIVRMNQKGGKWVADNSAVFDSLVYPLAKATLAFRKPFAPQQVPPADDQWKTIALLVPMVVVKSPLFLVEEADSPIAVPSGRVRLRRELKTKHLDGAFEIDFVRRENLAEFVSQDVIPFVEQLAEIAKERPDLLTSRTAPPITPVAAG